MKLTILKRVKAGVFLTFAEEMISGLADRFATEKEQLRCICDEMYNSLGADRINRPLRELNDKDLPKLRYLIRTLEGGLSLCDNPTDNDATMLKFISQSFKKRRDATRMTNEAMVLARFDAPEDELCAIVFQKIKALTEEMYEKLGRKGVAEAQIKTIGNCKSARKEAAKVIDRIRDRAVAMTYEADPAMRRDGEDALEILGTLISMGARMKRKRKGKNDGEKDADETEARRTGDATEEKPGDTENRKKHNLTTRECEKIEKATIFAKNEREELET